MHRKSANTEAAKIQRLQPQAIQNRLVTVSEPKLGLAFYGIPANVALQELTANRALPVSIGLSVRPRQH